MKAWFVTPMELPPLFIRYNPNYGAFLDDYFLHDYQLPDGEYTMESIYQVKHHTDVRKPPSFIRVCDGFIGWSTIPNPGDDYTLISSGDELALATVVHNSVPRPEGGFYVNLYAQWDRSISLGNIIDEASLLVRANFTDPNWRLFVPALAHAQNVAANNEATEYDIEFAIHVLKRVVDRHTPLP
jgi:hypothetical protein